MNTKPDLSLDRTLQYYREASSKEIEVLGQQKTLQLFQDAARGVPAYKDFLHKHEIDPDNITTIGDFKKVPIMTKQNYLTQYDMSDLCWDGQLSGLSIISSSSGSTGKPYFWPRGMEQEQQGAQLHELLLADFYAISQKKTLFINCFAMGSWVAGTYVLSSVEQLSWRGYPIISITPGIEIELIIQQFKALAPQFEQTIIAGYPPFIKDVLDAGVRQGVKWDNYSVKFLFAAEGFSEGWRAHIHRMVGAQPSDPISLNCYGSADAGLLAHETPTTNQIRQRVVQKDSISDFFGESRLPTMAQYDPQLRYFEEVDQKLIFSARAGIPLIRYDIGDNGRVLSYEDTFEKLSALGINTSTDLDEQSSHWKLPFVWVFGRQDLTVSLYGVLIFPEYVKYAIEPALSNKDITGKFSMSVDSDRNSDQVLHISVELSNGADAKPELAGYLEQLVLNGLIARSSEVKRLQQSIGEKVRIQVSLVSYNTGPFKVGAKQKWIVAS